MSIRVGILGYGNLGRGVECAVKHNPDMELINRQALHAWKLSFRHPITGEELHFMAPLPEDMEAVAGEGIWKNYFV